MNSEFLDWHLNEDKILEAFTSNQNESNTEIKDINEILNGKYEKSNQNLTVPSSNSTKNKSTKRQLTKDQSPSINSSNSIIKFSTNQQPSREISSNTDSTVDHNLSKKTKPTFVEVIQNYIESNEKNKKQIKQKSIDKSKICNLDYKLSNSNQFSQKSLKRTADEINLPAKKRILSKWNSQNSQDFNSQISNQSTIIDQNNNLKSSVCSSLPKSLSSSSKISSLNSNLTPDKSQIIKVNSPIVQKFKEQPNSSQSNKITDFFQLQSKPNSPILIDLEETNDKENSCEIIKSKFKHFKPPESKQIEPDERFQHNSGYNILVNKYSNLFENFEHFNEVQIGSISLVFESNESFIIKSSAASGKSTVLEFAIIKLLNELKPDEFKVIYIVSIKAIANEKFNSMNKFKNYGLSCCLITENSKYDADQIEKCSIIICTVEKLEAISRNSRDLSMLTKNLKLVLIDEIQLLADEKRGSYLEGFICRVKMDCKLSKNNIRYIAASSTIGNLDSICKFFGNNTKTIKFNDQSRVVPLEKIVIGYDCPNNYNDFKFDKIINSNLKKILDKYQNGQQVLIFCPTRKIAEESAQILKIGNYKRFISNVNELIKVSNKISAENLKDCFLTGVSYHHSGLSAKDKQIVEESFKKNLTSILACTTSFAVGINLPTNIVIIKGTFRYMNTQFIQYDEAEISKLIELAGRHHKIDNLTNSSNLIGLNTQSAKATAIIITKNCYKSRYEKMLNDKSLESKLLESLCEFLNAEVILGHLTSYEDVLNYIKSTFLYQRLLVNPLYYNIPKESTIDEPLKNLIKSMLENLNVYKVIKWNSANETIEKTEIGLIMSSNNISFQTLKNFSKINDKNIGCILQRLCECKELTAQSTMRNDEKAALTELNKDKKLRFPIRNKGTPKIQDLSQKINCLIQAELGQIISSNVTNQQKLQKFSSDANFYIKIAKQLAQALVDYFYLQNPRKLFSTFKSAILLAKSLKAGIWDNSNRITKQFDKIGFVYSTKLTEAGYTNFQKLKNATPSNIEMICGRNPNFGDEFLKLVNKVPEFELKVTQHAECENIGLFNAELVISIELKNYIHQPEGVSWLIVGDEEDVLLFSRKIFVSMFDTIDHTLQFQFECTKVKSGLLHFCLINDSIVGADCILDIKPKYSNVVNK